jgi:hypothetical protein
MSEKANDYQHGGSHYLACAIQPWDFIVSNGLPFLEGCIIKYVARHKRKGGLEDLKKAQHFLAKLIEEEEKVKPNPDDDDDADDDETEWVNCKTCGGTGDYYGEDPTAVECGQCHGLGGEYVSTKAD